MALRLHVPTRNEFGIRQGWLADPEMMSFNAHQVIAHPGYDPATGCIAWLESEWDAFEDRLALPPSAQGYFYVRDVDKGYVGHAHYRVDDDVAHIGINVIPERRGAGLGRGVLHLLIRQIWATTAVTSIENEFEDHRQAAVRIHEALGFVPDNSPASVETRRWILSRLTQDSGDMGRPAVAGEVRATPYPPFR